MKYGLMHTLRRLRRGESMARILMNASLSEETLRGRVVDVGGGHRPNYLEYFQQANDFKMDVLDGSMTGIDFEKDQLPYESASVDTVILCNVLEHMYHYSHLLTEIRRILKSEGSMIGFVPFWVGYHPDPHDYFRYTHECLARILEEHDFKNVTVTPVGGSPILGNFNTIVLTFPHILRPFIYLVMYAPIDYLFRTLRPSSKVRNPLGFKFSVSVR